MRVMVTGAAGLYGVHMVDELLGKESIDKIIAVDNFSRQFLGENPFLGGGNFDEKVEIIRDDFANIGVNRLNKLDLDAIIHFAAYVSIDESMINPQKYIQNNELGTFNFIQNIFNTKNNPLLIYASSPEVYGNPKYTPMDEDHPLNPRSTYAATKLAAEKHCLSLFEWYGYPVNAIRNFNTYGENQNIWGYSAAIPSFIEKALRNKPLPITGSGEQTRDFQYVKDAVRAYSLLLDNGDKIKGEVFNIGTG